MRSGVYTFGSFVELAVWKSLSGEFLLGKRIPRTSAGSREIEAGSWMGPTGLRCCFFCFSPFFLHSFLFFGIYHCPVVCSATNLYAGRAKEA